MSALSNIKHILAFAVAAAATAVAGACSADSDIDYSEESAPSGAVLRLSTGSSFTRADEHFADDKYAEQNEEIIGRVDLLFYSSDDPDEEPFYTYNLPDAGERTVADLSVKIPIELTSKFRDKKGYVYALVNLPQSIVVRENTITDSKGKSMPATLGNIGEVWVSAGEFLAAAQPSFVMRGGAEVDLNGSGRNAVVTGYIKLERLASKIRLWAEIPNELYIDRQTGKSLYKDENETPEQWEERKRGENVERWQPVTTDVDRNSSIKLYIYNLATNGRLDGTPDQAADSGYADIDRSENFERNNVIRRLSEADNLKLPVADRDDTYTYSHARAYYSYPNAWDSTTPAEQHQTYVILALPWKNVTESETGSEFEVYYYQIPVNALRDTGKEDADCLSPNRYYRIKLHVGMLGSKDLGSPLEMDASCEVVDWEQADVDVAIKPRRYLVVNQKQWVMNNVWTLEIPFSSSHDTEVVECYVNYFRYNDIWGTDNDTDDSEKHKSSEFTNWLALASAPDNNIKDSEGEISQDGLQWGTTVDEENKPRTLKQILYYKKEYFYDEIYAKWGRTDDAGNYGAGFKYYVGHEHPKTFQKKLIARPPQGFPQDGWDEFVSRYKMDSVYTCRIDNNKHVIRFDHPLVWWKEAYYDGRYYYVPELKNERLRDEYSRCEIIIKIRHADRPKDEHLFEETIHITQYPGLYVEVSHDYGSKVPASGSSGNEYVSVNKHTTESGLPTNWNEVSCYIQYFGFINMNPNMYVIHTTQLSEENEGMYILGDPRSLYYNNLLGIDKWYGKTEDNSLNNTTNVENPSNVWNQLRFALLGGWNFNNSEPVANAPRLYDGGNGYLKYYYPADETEGSGSKESFVAPVFRIASSFGKVSLCYSYAQDGVFVTTNYLDRESRREARRRCAAYQEAGRPAGRWRVPTISEIEYVMQLSVDKKIPHLFGLENRDNELYWCSTGLISINLVDIDTNPTVKGRITKRPPEYDIPQNRPPAVRCIYDEWYWNQIDGGKMPTPNGVIETTFYWGDRPKDNTQTHSILQNALTRKPVIATDE